MNCFFTVFSIWTRLIKKLFSNGKKSQNNNQRVRDGNGILFRVLAISAKAATHPNEKDTVDCPTVAFAKDTPKTKKLDCKH